MISHFKTKYWQEQLQHKDTISEKAYIGADRMNRLLALSFLRVLIRLMSRQINDQFRHVRQLELDLGQARFELS